jgi:hydrogenase 3 maturation protease
LVQSKLVTKQTAYTIGDWKAQLQELFKSSSKHNLALIGIGHPLRGDDYIGSFILKGLIKHSKTPLNAHLFDAEDSIESIVSKLVELKSKCIIFIDACEMNVAPGEIHLIPVAATEYPFFTTHGIPLKLLCERMLPESESWVLAVQPKQAEFSESLSPEVREAGLKISEYISKILMEVIS